MTAVEHVAKDGSTAWKWEIAGSAESTENKKLIKKRKTSKEEEEEEEKEEKKKEEQLTTVQKSMAVIGRFNREKGRVENIVSLENRSKEIGKAQSIYSSYIGQSTRLLSEEDWRNKQEWVSVFFFTK